VRRSLVVLLVVGAFLFASSPGPAIAQQRTRVVAHCTEISYQPAHYVFFCADGGAGLRHATYDSWKTWSARGSARGSATYYYNDCKPSCAGGTWHQQAATFRLYRVVDTVKHGPLFTRVRVTTKTQEHVYQLTTRPY
jgi:hypothetical protein